MSVRGIGMAHIAADADSSAEQLRRVKDLIALIDERVRLRLPDLEVAIVEARVGVALLAVELAGAGDSGSCNALRSAGRSALILHFAKR